MGAFFRRLFARKAPPAPQMWTKPAGVHRMQIGTVGGAGGVGVSGDVPFAIAPGQVIRIIVGQGGSAASGTTAVEW